MSLTSGFYNAFKVDGDYDRKYNAEDYSDNMGAIIRTGVLRDANNGFRVTASGLALSVSPGRAWIEGHWVKLDAAEAVATVTPPTGTYSRIDSVALRLNTNESVRAVSLVYTAGTTAAEPEAPAPVRSGGIYDIILAHISVAPGATIVTITDTRPDQTVCGWITTPVGYDDFFTAYDTAFNEWFQSAKDNMGSVSMYKQYVWRTVLDAASNTVQFSIPQYDPTGVDIINVYVNGLLEVEGVDYTLQDYTLTFAASKTSGTEIVVLCYKSIDGTGLGSVSDEINELQNAVAAQTYYALAADKTLYVNGSTGNDETGDGTSAAPYATIQKAINSLPKCLYGHHAQIDIAAGTYEERVTVDGFTGGRLTLGVAGRTVVIRGLTIMSSASVRVNISHITYSSSFTGTRLYLGYGSNVTLLSALNINNNAAAEVGIGLDHGSVLTSSGVDVTVQACGKAAILATAGARGAFESLLGDSNTSIGIQAERGAVVSYASRTMDGAGGDYTGSGGRILTGSALASASVE